MTTSKIYNWAMLGCGHIALKFSNDLKLLPNARLYASAARSSSRAQSFAKELGFEKYFGSYEEMLNDPHVDVVYIATPHSHHNRHVLMCINHNKAVLCEKAFAINLQETNEMIRAAQNQNVFLMEAFWTMFQPGFQQAMKIIKSGSLGALKVVRSDFGFKAEYNTEKRLYNVALGGGSLLDIGIYPVFASLMALGMPTDIEAAAQFSPTGSEESIGMVFKYPNGCMATLTSSFAAHSSIQSEYWCEKGFLRLERRWFTPTSIYIWHDTNKEERFDFHEKEGAGYQYEASHVMECLDKGLKESPIMPLSVSRSLMEILDKVRKKAKIRFPKHDGLGIG